MTTFYRLPAANGTGIKLQRHDNEVFIDNEDIDPERILHYVKTFPYQQGDILVCAFPKNGNHWIGNMIWKLKTLTDYNRPKMIDINPIEETVEESYHVQEEPRIIQTHLRPSRLPKEHMENNGKIVLMLRNPKDACVSYYYHTKNAEAYLNGQTFDEFFESYFSGEMKYASMLDYLKEWEDILYYQKKENAASNIILFYYEDFKMNPMENLRRLNNFLEFDRDKDYLEKVMGLTSFESMKTRNNRNKEEIHYCRRDVDGASVIYRQGKVGDWKNHFTVAQNDRVDVLIKQKLTRGIIKFKF